MNGPEERLRDALHHVGEIVQPGEVPPPPFPAKRRRTLSRPLAIGAVVAAVVVATTGVAAGGNAVLDRAAGERSAQNAAASGAQQLSVILCAKMSSRNWGCKGKDATEQQRQDIERRLRALPGVRSVDYVPRAEAYRAFKKQWAHEEWASSFRPANVSPYFQVRVEGTVNVKAMKAKVESVPGVDTVFIIPRRAGA